MKYDNNQKIINKLNKMPKVKDPLSKEELYQRVSAQMSRTDIRKRSTNLRNKLVPIFSTAFVVVILLILIPSFFDSEVSAPNDNILEQKNESSLLFNENNDSDEATNESDEAEEATEFTSYLLHEKDIDGLIPLRAFPDDQLQYAIPVTFILSQQQFDESSMNDLIDEEWGEHTDLFEGITFELDDESDELIAHLPDQFSLGEGEARAHMFVEVLSLMYTPVGFDKVVFSSHNAQEVDLGPFGTVSELKLVPLDKAVYKIYEPTEAQRDFFVPIRQSDQSVITDALDEMKIAEDDFDIAATIPAHIQFDVAEDDTHLMITFSDESKLNESQQVVTMIEAILATAKTYGYEDVKFSNTSFKQIGNYDLTRPIKVPEAVNPVTR